MSSFNKITTGDMVRDIAAAHGMTQQAVRATVDALFGQIVAYLETGTRVDLHKIGVLEPVERAARTGRNVQTGETIEIPARFAVRFKPSKALKDALN